MYSSISLNTQENIFHRKNSLVFCGCFLLQMNQAVKACLKQEIQFIINLFSN